MSVREKDRHFCRCERAHRTSPSSPASTAETRACPSFPVLPSSATIAKTHGPREPTRAPHGDPARPRRTSPPPPLERPPVSTPAPARPTVEPSLVPVLHSRSPPSSAWPSPAPMFGMESGERRLRTLRQPTTTEALHPSTRRRRIRAPQSSASVHPPSRAQGDDTPEQGGGTGHEPEENAEGDDLRGVRHGEGG